ncbi:MAG: lipoyl synthase [Euryarchaeota archaeon]|nr:lipoyl synthase [Euryarchaeota archaeon]
METDLGTALPKPDWLKVKAVERPEFADVRDTLRTLNVRTVCDPSHCPNRCECWSSGTATFLMLGGVCTRGCRFCSVPKGAKGDEISSDEPERIAEAVAKLGLRHVVITSVTRDDLADHGSDQYASVVRAVHERSPRCAVELLVPDLGGSRERLGTILTAGPEVLGHNIETVERATHSIRDGRASYSTSLKLLAMSKEISPGTLTKSSIMVGLGESRDELCQAMDDLREAEVDMLTVGQYLRPSKAQVEVSRYVTPEEFADIARTAKEKGFRHVSSGPFVRSSYRAAEAYESIRGCNRC